MGTHTVEPGSVLADRYVVEDLLAEEGESDSWRARDKVLARSVVLQVVPSSSPTADKMLAAAKRASRVTDPRILQVLDAVEDGELSYVVREWASGQSLDVVLSEGPLSARRTTWVLREVAGALVSAHQMGLVHRRLAPDTVVITKASGVKLIGLGTFAALRPDPDDAEDLQREDTRGLGRLLYACLTARWPGRACDGLPAAPTEHGRLLRPRQVRAGVPRALDTVCDRILANPPRSGEPISTVAQVNDELARILGDDGFADRPSVVLSTPEVSTAPAEPEPPPALLDPDNGGPPTGDQPTAPAADPPNETQTPLGRTLMWTVVVVLVVGVLLLAYLVSQRGLGDTESPPASSPPADSQSAQAHTKISIRSATDFDPSSDGGNGHEHPEEVKLAIDGDRSTSWETMAYYGDPELGGLKSGVGLVLDLGKTQKVGRVSLDLVGKPTSVQLRAAPASATSAPTSSASDYTMLGSHKAAGSNATFTLDKPARTRYLLVWFTSLP
ncbi:MAG: protein kinase family protein, partial [Nocardioidaceae bacterium]